MHSYGVTRGGVRSTLLHGSVFVPAYEVPALPQLTSAARLGWLNRASKLPMKYIESGHFYDPGVWSHPRSVMADLVAYLLSRPKQAVPKQVCAPPYAHLGCSTAMKKLRS
jgi:hypothetical protein